MSNSTAVRYNGEWYRLKTTRAQSFVIINIKTSEAIEVSNDEPMEHCEVDQCFSEHEWDMFRNSSLEEINTFLSAKRDFEAWVDFEDAGAVAQQTLRYGQELKEAFKED